MAQRKTVRETAQYNTEMYMARLTLKNPAVHFCTLLIVIYTIIRTVLSAASIISGGNILIALISVVGLLLLSTGSVMSLLFSRDGGNRLIFVLKLPIIGSACLFIASVMEVIFLKADAETFLQSIFLIVAVIVAVSVLSAAKGDTVNTTGCYFLGIFGFATLLFSIIALISVVSALRGCFVDSYNWSFFSEEIDVNTTQIKWYFLGSKIAGTSIRTVFVSRFIERIVYTVLILTISATALKMAPYINKEMRTIEFAQDAGDFTAFDGGDFRTISKRRVSENVRNQSYYGIGTLDRGEEEYNKRISKPANNYKTNEYGDYLDEETGIFYYFDNRTGRYYYLNENTGEYVYKTEGHEASALNPADAMPWELTDTDLDEDNIYNY